MTDRQPPEKRPAGGQGEKPEPFVTASDSEARSIAALLTDVRVPGALGQAYFDDVDNALITEMARLALTDPEEWKPGMRFDPVAGKMREVLVNTTMNSFPRVCRRFRDLAKDFAFWTDLDLAIVADKFQRLTGSPTDAFRDLFQATARFGGCTRLSGAKLSGGLAAALARWMPNLRFLRIATANSYEYTHGPTPDGGPAGTRTITLDRLLGELAVKGTVQSLCMHPDHIENPTPAHEHAFSSLTELECCPGVAARTAAPELTRLAIDTWVDGLYDPAPTLARFPKLRSLKIDTSMGVIDIRAIPPIPGLESLDLHSDTIAMNPGDIERAFGTVRDARFAVRSITPELWFEIWNLSKLRKLAIGASRVTLSNFAAVWQDPPGAEPLADLKLEYLRFDPTPLFSSRRCRDLQRLALEGCSVPTSSAAVGLGHLSYLSVVRSGNPRFTAAAIDAATGLQEVHIAAVHDGALAESLATRNTSVTRLSLQIGSGITQLPDLRRAFPSLRVLTLDIAALPGIRGFVRRVTDAVDAFTLTQVDPVSIWIIYARVARVSTPATVEVTRKMIGMIDTDEWIRFKMVYTFHDDPEVLWRRLPPPS